MLKRFLQNRDCQTYDNVKLADFTTFRLGGSCPALILCTTPKQLEDVILSCRENDVSFILIGAGSNLVVSDDGLDCCVIRYYSDDAHVERDGNDLVVSGSSLLDDVVKYAIDQGLAGLNYASGIPGTVGGAIAGNAGAFGQQVGDCLYLATVINAAGAKKEILAQGFSFSYRHSILKETNDIVLSARFKMTQGNKKDLLKERGEILTLRREKHPDLNVWPCAGSFFRNIEPTSNAERRQAAGWFLEESGAKALKVGGAQVFEKHANIIVRADETCTSQDVYDLSKKMQEAVKEKFDLDLTREVHFLGKFDHMPQDVTSVIW